MENTTITLHQENFPDSALLLADSGYFLDVLALSAKQWTQNELDENNWDYYAESMQYPLDQFNFEDAYIAALNAGTETPPVGLSKKSKLLPGADFALNHSEEFSDALGDYENKLREQFTDCIGDYHTDNEELNAEATKHYEDVQEEQYHSWLHGDYRGDHDGILKHAERYHGFEEVDYSDNPGTLTIEVSPEWVQENITDQWEEGTKITDKLIKESIISSIAYSAQRYTEEEARKRKTRNEEHAKTREYQKQRAADAEQARINKLKAMTRILLDYSEDLTLEEVKEIIERE